MDRIEIVCPHCHQLNVRYRGGLGGVLNPLYARYCKACGAELATGRFGVVDWLYAAMMFLAVYLAHIFAWSAFIVLPVGLVARLSGAPTPSVQTAAWIAFAVAVVAGISSAERARRKGQMLSVSEAPSASVATDATALATAEGRSQVAPSVIASTYGAQARVVTPTRKRKLIPWLLLLTLGPLCIMAAYSAYGDKRAMVREGVLGEGTVVKVSWRHIAHTVSTRRTVIVEFVAPSGRHEELTRDSETLKPGDHVRVRYLPARPGIAEIELDGEAPGSGITWLAPLFIGLAMILGSIAYLVPWPRKPSS